MVAWSPQQELALSKIKEWMEAKGKLFCLFGYAGTGKTTLAKEIASYAQGKVLFGAYTGKAAQVLQSKGCEASTIHSMIYRPIDPFATVPTFLFNHDSDVKRAKLIIIDECSMIDEEMGKDLMSFGVPILVLGDPAQLPPIGGGGFFTDREPDFILTEIHRQALDNPIIAMSIKIREGGNLLVGQYGESEVALRRNITDAQLMEADQVLCGTNATRANLNQKMRALQGRKGVLEVGEKIICLRNDYRADVFNGTTWIVKSVKMNETQLRLLDMEIEAIDEPDTKRKVSVLREFFTGQKFEMTYDEKKFTQQFTYGYAITVHKAQGSQYDNVLLFDESYCFKESAKEWRYTGVTRAAKKVIVAI